MVTDFKMFRIFILLSIPVLCFSCIKEEFDPDKLDTEIIIHPGVAAPLGFIHYGLEELLKDTLHPGEMIMDNDGFISMVYEKEILSYQVSGLMQFSDIQYSGSIDNKSPLPLNLSFIQDTLVQSDTIFFELIGSNAPEYTEIDSIRLDSMVIIINLSYSHDLRGDLLVYSPGITRDGVNWSEKIPLSSNVTSFKLENYTIILSNDPPNVNQVPIICKLTLINSSGIINPGAPILNYSVEIKNIDYSVIFGYLGIVNIGLDPQIILISLYNSIIDGTFHFEEPVLKLYIENSFGLPVRIIMTDFYAISGDGNQIDITGDSVPSAEYERIIRYPVEPGQTAYDSLILNPENTNLFDVIESSPRSITFGAEAVTNPSGNNTHNNFITDQSCYGVKAKLILPLYGCADFMFWTDTLRFDFEDFFQNPPEEIKGLTFRLNFINGFPVNVYAQIYFTDENYIIIDSLFNDRHLIEAGTDINGDGKIDPVRMDLTEVEFTRSKIDNISEARHILFNCRINTTNYDLIPPEVVKFYSHYFIDAYIGVVGDIELNSAGN